MAPRSPCRSSLVGRILVARILFLSSSSHTLCVQQIRLSNAIRLLRLLPLQSLPTNPVPLIRYDGLLHTRRLPLLGLTSAHLQHLRFISTHRARVSGCKVWPFSLRTSAASQPFSFNTGQVSLDGKICDIIFLTYGNTSSNENMLSLRGFQSGFPVGLEGEPTLFRIPTNKIRGARGRKIVASPSLCFWGPNVASMRSSPREGSA